MKLINNICLTAFAVLAFNAGNAQKASQKIDYSTFPAKKSELTQIERERWSHLDLAKDSLPGMSVDRAYAELLKDRKAEKIIVAVIDSGVDIEHEDLQSVVWINKKEIAGNGVDDDKNGYIDDVHGWNFLGDANDEQLEMTRIVKKGDDGSETYKAAKAAYDEKYAEAMGGKQQVDFIFNALNTISEHLKKEDYTVEEIRAIQPNTQQLAQSQMIMLSIIEQTGPNFREELDGFKKQINDMINVNLNLDFDGRKVVGDNVNDIKDTKYGNNNVIGLNKEDADHGTHVAGIIAQIRNNGKGGDGVANNVEIMAIRAVPNGDEYDKDIALAIRYAVDNGAKVINGSFGKSFSPQKQWVFDAIKYAASKDVLIVHAAGNDGHNIDLPGNNNFPNDSEDGVKEISNNLITIGALAPTLGSEMVASFSNYGKSNVDIFAPGKDIYATVPNNKYVYHQGTSMASPNAAGVASLIRSYYPSLTAAQVKTILMDSGTPMTHVVELGSTSEQKPFTEASKSGKIVNAYNALLMAEKMAKTKKKK
ncbi:MAG: S8 family peptidase [Flavobacterium sp.]|nr:S8 family peptidase [Flavobacterium sp.]